ncbi:hypothetical protein F4805DRAFT_447717 [Annulohypoxylon moriforme]|nr:hypothetical protein F4805DRAFT_447717 [Annulohypoxylon moriforme]
MAHDIDSRWLKHAIRDSASISKLSMLGYPNVKIFHHCCRCCCRHRRTVTRPWKSLSPTHSLKHSPRDNPNDNTAPSPIDQWRTEVRPGSPLGCVPPPEDLDQLELESGYSEQSDDMPRTRITKASSTRASANVAEYCDFLERNNIRVWSLIESPDLPDIPSWLNELISKVLQPIEYPLGYKSIDIERKGLLEEWHSYKLSRGAAFEGLILNTLPITQHRFFSHYSACISELPGSWRGGSQNSQKIGVTREAALAHHYKGFPRPDLLVSSKPDVAAGYNQKWLKETLKEYPNEVDPMVENYKMNSEKLLFPYLISEIKTDCNGGKRDAHNQLQTASAAALNCTKELLRKNNTVFSVSVIYDEAYLCIMWIHGTMDQPQYLFNIIKHYSFAKEDQVIEFQKDLINIHIWGQSTRRKEVEQELIEEMVARMNGTTRPRASFEPRSDDSISKLDSISESSLENSNPEHPSTLANASIYGDKNIREENSSPQTGLSNQTDLTLISDGL